MTLASGFPEERIAVVPRPLVARALREPVTSALLVTDVGYFPHARSHYRARPAGARESIVIACIDGEGWCESGDRRLSVNRGDVVVIPAGERHSYGASADIPWTIWWLHVIGTAVADLLRYADPDARRVVHRSDVYGGLDAIDDALRTLERGDSPAHLVRAAGAAWHFLTSLAGPGERERPDPVERAIAHLHRNVASTVTVAELAALANLSPSHFAALFRRTTGTSVLQYFTGLKMAAARELLERQSLDVAEVARAVGYTDPFYFSRQFRRFHGMSPSTFRAERARRPAS